MSSWIDITRPVDETLVTWPGRGRPEHHWDKQIATGGHCNVSSWHWNAHSGTHMDAPLHFVEGGLSIDRIPPEVFLGDCEVLDLGPGEVLTEEMAATYAGARRLLLKSSHSQRRDDGAYAPHEALMSDAAASLLVEQGLRLIGTDRLSVDDSRGENFAVHHRLLRAGCVIIEGLLLGAIAPGSYELVAAPLRLSGTEASPVRAFLKSSPGPI